MQFIKIKDVDGTFVIKFDVAEYDTVATMRQAIAQQFNVDKYDVRLTINGTIIRCEKENLLTSRAPCFTEYGALGALGALRAPWKVQINPYAKVHLYNEKPDNIIMLYR